MFAPMDVRSLLYPIQCSAKETYLTKFFLQTNGLTERFNQMLSQCLAKVCNEDQTNWDEKLDTVLMGYRASRQASTKHSPYYMLFQQHMRFPIDAEVLSPSNIPDENAPDVDTAVQALIKSREKVFKKADSFLLSWIPVSKHRGATGSTLSSCSERGHSHGYSQLHSTAGRQH